MHWNVNVKLFSSIGRGLALKLTRSSDRSLKASRSCRKTAVCPSLAHDSSACRCTLAAWCLYSVNNIQIHKFLQL